MSIEEIIKNATKDAMRAKDSVRLNSLRGLTAAFTNELVAKGKKPQESISDEDATAVILREIKKRKDSIEQFKAGNRADLVQSEEQELKIIEEFAPQMMSLEEIEKVVMAKQQELGISDKSKMGMLMGAVMKELKGKANGSDVKTAVEKLFS